MDGEIALWIKIAYTAQLAVILPVYAVVWGWRNPLAHTPQYGGCGFRLPAYARLLRAN